MNCPTTETLQRLALGFLEDEEPVRAHASKCDACRTRLGALNADHHALSSAAKAVAVPSISKPVSRRWIFSAVACLALAFALTIAFSPRSDPSPEPLSVEKAKEIRGPQDYEYYTKERADGLMEWSTSRPERPMCKEEPREEEAKPRNSDCLAVGDMSLTGGRLGDRKGGGVTKGDPKSPDAMYFKDHGINPVVDTAKQAQSTFGLDVDTASYTLVRNYLKRGALPPKEAVRVEEFLNYFRYHDQPPANGTFAIRLEAAPSPFDKERHLLRIAIQAKEIKAKDRKDVVLTFVIDVSGSMAQENRLELVKKSLRFLVDKLRPTDRIGIVVYGSTAHKLLDHTPVLHRDQILGIIDELRTQGSTNVAAGLKVGYELAASGFDPKATNRVVLCSDGVANNGDTSPEGMLASIKEKVEKGIYLSSLGFGMGNHNDHLLEKLADTGNGNYAYIDDLAEAKKIFSEKLVGMMEVVAADAKVQVEFDAATVAEFRLVGYENRHIENKDFRNDKVDAGEVGAGHHVTALYEIRLKPDAKGRLATVRLRYREPDTKEVVETHDSLGAAQVRASMKDASPSFRLAAVVAQFAEVLRDNAKGITLEKVLEEAHRASKDMDDPADAVEFVALVRKAADLKKRND